MVSHLPERSRARQGDPGRAERYRRAVCESDLPPTARLIAHTLAAHAAEEYTEMSRTELARAAGLDRSAITRNLPKLVTKSWLVAEVPPAPEARRGARTRYTLVIPSEAATVTAIQPGRTPLAARRVMARTGCTEAEAAAVVATLREENPKVRSMPAYLNGIPDDELAEYLADVRATPPAAGVGDAVPQWCSTHAGPGGTLASGLPRCAQCRHAAKSPAP